MLKWKILAVLGLTFGVAGMIWGYAKEKKAVGFFELRVSQVALRPFSPGTGLRTSATGSRNRATPKWASVLRTRSFTCEAILPKRSGYKRLKAVRDDPEFAEVLTKQEANPDTKQVLKVHNIDTSNMTECEKPSKVTFWLICCALFSLPSIAQRTSPADKIADVSRWKTFANRAGWTIKHPNSWQVGGCAHCSDPTDPNGLVTIYNPSTRESIMIEHLIDKPTHQTIEQWLNDVKVTTVLNPLVFEEWISLNGTRALKVINRNTDSTWSENIYMVHGSKTFAMRADASSVLFPRMLSTFRFTSK